MCAKIKAISPKTPIIITTAFSDSEYLMKAIEIGIDKYVTKPVDIDKLYNALDEMYHAILYKKEKETQEKYLRYILDFNPSFILIASNKKIEYINQTFLDFLGFSSFDEFKSKVKEVDNLVDTIKDINGNSYSTKDWIEQIVKNDNIQHIIHFKHLTKKPFIVLQNSLKDLNKDILLFSDVTNLELNRLSLNDEIIKLKLDNEKKLELLKIQSKQALMGEMISAIAHQWKQPLNALSLNIQLVRDGYEFGDLTDKEIKSCIEVGLKQIEYMARTINDFKDFLSPTKEMKKFCLKDAFDGVLSLFSRQFEVHHIDLNINIQDNLEAFGYKNEFEQVIINLIKNSKDGFDTKDIENKLIEINASESENYLCISVKDNAGGISDNIMEEIFEPYFSTKIEKDGTGLGLYMSKIIIEEHCGGTIIVYNDKNGAVFKIKL